MADVRSTDALAATVATFEEANRKIEEQGLVVLSPRGEPIENPFLKIRDKAALQIQKLESAMKAPAPEAPRLVLSKPLTNAKHERFAQALADGIGVGDAYVAAGYPANRGNATKLKQRESIATRVAQILAERQSIRAHTVAKAIDESVADEKWILNKLIENVERASQAQPVLDSEGNPTGEYRYEGSVVNRALELLGKQRGMFIDRKEIRTGPLDTMSLEQRRERALAAARRLGATRTDDCAGTA